MVYRTTVLIVLPRHAMVICGLPLGKAWCDITASIFKCLIAIHKLEWLTPELAPYYPWITMGCWWLVLEGVSRTDRVMAGNLFVLRPV
ncbi:Uncharacterised protein [Vibrio cholerae]|nr:Uncharacterised protein [Vibrio cholerae]CSB64024.1 Uncharacterised protein [Vibrio cholerae]CSI36713.1 Uncharacterised protein [Vibrio cholerae]